MAPQIVIRNRRLDAIGSHAAIKPCVELLRPQDHRHAVVNLNTLTKWKGTPWKWLFSNPKKNGYCDRWNYKFAVREVDGETRYCTSPKYRHNEGPPTPAG